MSTPFGEKQIFILIIKFDSRYRISDSSFVKLLSRIGILTLYQNGIIKSRVFSIKGEKMEFRLKTLRKERKISQLKLALDLNMNQNTISRYENMEREADYETLIRFANYFGVSIDYLLGRTKEK